MLPWQSCEFDQHEQVCFFTDPDTQLKAIVAVHSTLLGAAVGGTRFMAYQDDQYAVNDALRLSRAMSYKCALAGLPCGGGKAVIIGAPATLKTKALLHAFGRILNRIGTTFATGEDIGISPSDIDTISEVTRFAGGEATKDGAQTSDLTAQGIFLGMLSVLEHRFGKSMFSGVHFAIQGLGSVGMELARLLSEAGARLTVADIDEAKVKQAVIKFGAASASTEEIHAVGADVFVPCALNGIVNETTLPQFKVGAIAGAANNQLTSRGMGSALHERGILFAPDYVLNAGGVIGSLTKIAALPGRTGVQVGDTEASLRRIYTRLASIFERSKADNVPPEREAHRLACELIGR